MEQAEIIAIGTELTSGAKLDTNSQWLSLQLADLGIPVTHHTTLADDLVGNVAALRIAVERVDLILVTGGLGPTLDDLTREALAQLAGVELVLDERSLEHIEGFFRSRGREMPPRNRLQAMLPAGAEALFNPIGTAPGVWMMLPRPHRAPCHIAALPGVPSEMHRMFFEQVRPRLTCGDSVIRRARINCFGLGESHTEQLLGELTARGREPDIGITAHDATITLRIIARGKNDTECRRKIDEASAQIRERLGDYVFGVEDEELEDVVVRLLQSQRKTLVTVETATAGELAQRLCRAQFTQKATAFKRGDVLPMPDRSPLELARRARETSNADLAAVVGPESFEFAPSEHSVSKVILALVGCDFEQVAELSWSGNPAIFCSRTAKSLLDLLRRQLLGIDIGPYACS